MSINNDLSPAVPPTIEKEPMLLLDTAGSMNEPISETSKIPRRELVGEALASLVEVLEKADSQAVFEHEEGAGASGLMTITFAGGQGECIDDLSSANFWEKFDAIRWEGGTEIMPGWNTLVDTYVAAFGSRPADKRPALLALMITDGIARDIDEFATVLRNMGLNTYVVAVLVGYGAEHDRALNAWAQVAKENDHVRVVTFTGQTDPHEIANSLLALMK